MDEIGYSGQIIFGHRLRIGEEIPEFGSLTVTNISEDGIYTWGGLSKDKALLPTGWPEQNTGSIAIFSNDQSAMMYEKTSDHWFNVSTGGGGGGGGAASEAGIESVYVDSNNHLIFIMSDGTVLDAGELPEPSVEGYATKEWVQQNYITPNAVANLYYSKSEAENKFADKNDVYTKTAVDNAFAKKTDLDDYLKSADADAKFALSDDVYSANEIDAKLADYAKSEDLDDYAKTSDIEDKFLTKKVLRIHISKKMILPDT